MFAIRIFSSVVFNAFKKRQYIGKISTLYLKTLKSFQLKPIIYLAHRKRVFIKYVWSVNKSYVVVNYFTYEYPKVSFLPICIQQLSLVNIAFLPCLCYKFT